MMSVAKGSWLSAMVVKSFLFIAISEMSTSKVGMMG